MHFIIFDMLRNPICTFEEMLLWLWATIYFSLLSSVPYLFASRRTWCLIKWHQAVFHETCGVLHEATLQLFFLYSRGWQCTRRRSMCGRCSTFTCLGMIWTLDIWRLSLLFQHPSTQRSRSSSAIYSFIWWWSVYNTACCACNSLCCWSSFILMAEVLGYNVACCELHLIYT